MIDRKQLKNKKKNRISGKGSRELPLAKSLPLPPKPSEKVRHIVSWGFALVLAAVLGAFLAVIMLQSVTMQESSMEPTVSVGDRYFMNRIIYRVTSPKRGDIIAFRTNGSDEAALHIRRVIGLPGETIQIVDGRILINGEAYREPGQDFPIMSNAGLAANPVSLENNEYFVLGDNRNNSEDSRYGEIGVINKKYISGKLWFQTYPLKEAGFVSKYGQ